MLLLFIQIFVSWFLLFEGLFPQTCQLVVQHGLFPQTCPLGVQHSLFPQTFNQNFLSVFNQRPKTEMTQDCIRKGSRVWEVKSISKPNLCQAKTEWSWAFPHHFSGHPFTENKFAYTRASWFNSALFHYLVAAQTLELFKPKDLKVWIWLVFNDYPLHACMIIYIIKNLTGPHILTDCCSQWIH